MQEIISQVGVSAISQIIGSAVGVWAGSTYMEKRIKKQQKPRQDLMEKHKKNIEQFMLFYICPREVRPARAKDFNTFIKSLTKINKDIILNFFRHTQIVESIDELEILFDVEYLKNNKHQDKFPIVDKLFTHYHQLLIAGCFDEELFEVLKGAPRQNINYNPIMDIRPITKEEIDALFEENEEK